jgi:hypothetical protein
VNYLLQNLASVEDRTTSLEGRVTSLESRMTALEGRVTTIEGILPELVVAGYGGMYGSAVDMNSFIVPAAWTDITAYTNYSFSNNRGIVNNIVTGTTKVDVQGVWQMNVVLFFDHDESNQSRDINVRFFNKTEGTATPLLFNIGIARNQTSSNVSLSFLTDVAPDVVGHEFVLQWQAGVGVVVVDTFSWIDWTVTHVGEWVDENPPLAVDVIGVHSNPPGDVGEGPLE